MIKKLILAVALALPIFGASAQTLKIGIVDTSAIMQAMPDTQAAQEKLTAAQKEYDAQSQKLNEEGQKMVEEFQKMGDNTLPAIRERKARDIQEQQSKIEQFYQTAQQDLQRMQQELMAPIVQKVRDAIEAVGREQSFSMIENYESSLLLYYAAPVIDITPDVKTRLNLK